MKLVVKTFEEGIEALCAASLTATHIIGNCRDEASVTATLATSAVMDRPTGNGVGWNRCVIKVGAFGVEFKTRGGLVFGWECNPNLEYPYVFFLYHPDEWFPESDLLQSAKKAGFVLEEEEEEFLREIIRMAA